MHNLGPIVWLIIVAFGVISSIRKNAQRAQAQRAARPTRDAATTAAAGSRAGAAACAVAGRIRDAAGRCAAAAASSGGAAGPGRPAAACRSPQLHEPALEPRRFVACSAGSATLVRAIVAAEVLGPPKAFQEQTI